MSPFLDAIVNSFIEMYMSGYVFCLKVKIIIVLTRIYDTAAYGYNFFVQVVKRIKSLEKFLA